MFKDEPQGNLKDLIRAIKEVLIQASAEEVMNSNFGQWIVFLDQKMWPDVFGIKGAEKFAGDFDYFVRQLKETGDNVEVQKNSLLQLLSTWADEGLPEDDVAEQRIVQGIPGNQSNSSNRSNPSKRGNSGSITIETTNVGTSNSNSSVITIQPLSEDALEIVEFLPIVDQTTPILALMGLIQEQIQQIDDIQQLTLWQLMLRFTEAQTHAFCVLDLGQMEAFWKKYDSYVHELARLDGELDAKKSHLCKALWEWSLEVDGLFSVTGAVGNGEERDLFNGIFEIVFTWIDTGKFSKSSELQMQGLMKTFGKDINRLKGKTISQKHWRKFVELYNSLSKSLTNKPLDAAMEIIKTFLGYWQKGANVFLLSDMESENVFVKKVKEPKPCIELSELEVAFYNLCEIDAFYDLLSGKLHRLDPVIMDSGCQWRVPFVLDLHAFVLDKCNTLGADLGCLVQYEKVRSTTINLREWLRRNHEFGNLRTPFNKSGELVIKVSKKSVVVATKAKQFFTCPDNLLPRDIVLKDVRYIYLTEEERSLAKGQDTLWGIIHEREIPGYRGHFFLSVGELGAALEQVKFLSDSCQRDGIFLMNQALTGLKDATNFMDLVAALKNALDDFDKGLGEVLYSKCINRLAGKDTTTKVKAFRSLDYLVQCKIFTVNRIRRMDLFEISGVRIDLDLPLRDSVLKYFTRALARYSRVYMGHISSLVVAQDKLGNNGPVKLTSEAINELIISNPVRTSQNGARFKSHVFYGPLQSIFTYQCVKNQPIIIDLRRLDCVEGETVIYSGEGLNVRDAEYRLNGAEVLYYEPDGNGNFVFVPEPSEIQMNTVGMCVECFSINDVKLQRNIPGVHPDLDSNDFNAYLGALTQLGIVDLIMWGASMHDETPSPIFLPEGPMTDNENTIENEVIRLYELVHDSKKSGEGGEWSLTDNRINLFGETVQSCHLWQQRKTFQKLLSTCGISAISYKTYVNSRTMGIRTVVPVIFAPIHIYGCTYAIKKATVANLNLFHNEQKPRSGRLMETDHEHDQNV